MNKEKIIKTRNAFKLTQAQAAELVHCKTLTWSQWETGRNNMHPAFWELFLIKATRKLNMKTKIHVSYDGNSHGLFNNMDEAEIYIMRKEGMDGSDEEILEELNFLRSERKKYGSNFYHDLWFTNEIVLSDDEENIILFCEQPYDEYIESISDEIGSEEFNKAKKSMTEYLLG